MDEATNSFASNLIMQNIMNYLIKTGVVNGNEYIEYTEKMRDSMIEGIKHADLDNKELSEEVIREAFDGHLDFIKLTDR
jgi:hypothetical protein